MNIIDSSATKIAHFIKNNYSESRSIEFLTYSLIIAINTFLSLFVVFAISLFTGNLDRFAIAVSILLVIRYVTGGVHLSSSLSCCIFTIISFALIILVRFEYFYIGLVLDILSVFIFSLRAPRGIDIIRPVSDKVKRIIKVGSILAIASNFYFQESLLSAVFFLQAISLTDTMDNIVNPRRR